MDNMLLKIKRVLNTYTDDELKETALWINNEDIISMIVIEKSSITLVTNKSELKINDKIW